MDALPTRAFDPSTPLPLPRLSQHQLRAKQRSRAPLTDDDVARCARAIASSSWSAGDGPVLLSYATGTFDERTGRSFVFDARTGPGTWLFGLSAALHKQGKMLVDVNSKLDSLLHPLPPLHRSHSLNVSR